MSRQRFSLLLFCLFLCFFPAFSLFSNEPVSHKIRVKVFWGGHPFNLEEFKNYLFEGCGNFIVSYAELPEERDLLAPGLEKECDVLVMFDMDQKDPTPEQKKNLQALLNKGIGYFAFHHNLCSLYDWDEYFDICGGKALLDYAYPQGAEQAVFRGKEYPFSTFLMGSASFSVADRGHPIMKGVEDFHLEEELYGNIITDPQIHPLLVSESPNMNKIVSWTWHYAHSPVFATLLGHDEAAWRNKDFHQMFLNAIEWLDAETQKERARIE